MEVFTIHDLRNRTGDLIRGAENGELTLVTKHGKPVFVAVPFTEALQKGGVQRSLAAHLFAKGYITLVQAAKLAGVSASEMLDELASRNIPVVNYSEDELADEYNASHFSKAAAQREALLSGNFIGCSEGEAGLSEAHNEELSESLSAKHDDR